eukprot:380636-Pelagomonas_calceolata.AAC.13
MVPTCCPYMLSSHPTCRQMSPQHVETSRLAIELTSWCPHMLNGCTWGPVLVCELPQPPTPAGLQANRAGPRVHGLTERTVWRGCASA